MKRAGTFLEGSSEAKRFAEIKSEVMKKGKDSIKADLKGFNVNIGSACKDELATRLANSRVIQEKNLAAAEAALTAAAAAVLVKKDDDGAAVAELGGELDGGGAASVVAAEPGGELDGGDAAAVVAVEFAFAALDGGGAAAVVAVELGAEPDGGGAAAVVAAGFGEAVDGGGAAADFGGEVLTPRSLLRRRSTEVSFPTTLSYPPSPLDLD